MDQGGDLLRVVLQWIGAAALAGIGWLLAKIRAVEDRMDKRITDMEAKSTAARDKQWNALESVRKEVGDFKEKMLDNMASKSDLEKTEKRLIENMERMLKK